MGCVPLEHQLIVAAPAPLDLKEFGYVAEVEVHAQATAEVVAHGELESSARHADGAVAHAHQAAAAGAIEQRMGGMGGAQYTPTSSATDITIGEITIGGALEHGGIEHGGIEHGDAVAGAYGMSGAADREFEGSAAVDVEVHAEMSVPETGPGSAAEHLGGEGVCSIGSGPPQVTALLDANIGLNVDGFRVALPDLGPIAGDADGSLGVIPTDGSIHASAHLEHAQLPTSGGETHLVVQVRGGEATSQARTRVRVHLVIDRSSSMQSTWHEVQAAARVLVSQLHPDDHLQIVTYGTESFEVFPTARVGDGSAANHAIDEIAVGGGTNIQDGLEAAYGAVAESRIAGNDRPLVILLSDGVPTRGAFDAEGLAPLASRARVEHACTTTVIGLGNQFSPRTLRAIARAGRGSYHVARSTRELAPTLRAELRAQQEIPVRDVELDLQLDASVRVAGILDGDAGAEQVEGHVRLSLPQLREGEERRIVVRLEVDGNTTPSKVARVGLGWRPSAGHAPRYTSKDVTVGFGAMAQTTEAGLAVIDAHLGQTLDRCTVAVENGRAEEARAMFQAHVSFAEGRAAWRTNPRLRNRTLAVSRVGRALGELLGGASHGQRRDLAIALGGYAIRLGR